eukprot:m.303859 g.303859  ORF g.303859 m.303859 type:complete len:215 (+) comp16282_c0_seq1:233-877(+)
MAFLLRRCLRPSLSPVCSLKRMTSPAAPPRVLLSSSQQPQSSGSAPGVFQGLWLRYLAHLEARPLLVKCLTSGAISLGGDALCQLAIERKDWDTARFAQFGLLGAILVAPTLHVWYGFLGRATTSSLLRLAADQLVFAPVFVVVFFGALLASSGRADELPAMLRRDWADTVRANWVIWIPAQFVNFRFVPGHLQVLFSNLVGLAWNVYLSWKTH